MPTQLELLFVNTAFRGSQAGFKRRLAD